MKIVNITTELQYIELKTPFITALRTARHVEFVRVRVECDSGAVGIGEAPATKAITGEDLETISDSIENSKEKFYMQMPSEAIEILHLMCQDIKSSAKAALDMAFVSLMAQEKNIPLFEYFGVNEARVLQTDVTISLKSSQQMLEDAKVAYSKGLYILKVKLGFDISHAVEVIKSISAEFPHAEILVDANQAWHVESTLRFIDETRSCKIELIEQPVIATDLVGLKTISEYSDVPILADEAVFTLADAKAVIQSKSAQMINIKLMKCAGLTKAVEILEYCREMGVKCMLGSMLEGPYSINAALHLAQAYRDVIRYIDLDSPLLYKEPSSELDFEFHGCDIVLKSEKL
jgi:L-alanine-DL-glutamate epimerase-like enolase superfamily enzyme